MDTSRPSLRTNWTRRVPLAGPCSHLESYGEEGKARRRAELRGARRPLAPHARGRARECGGASGRERGRAGARAGGARRGANQDDACAMAHAARAVQPRAERGAARGAREAGAELRGARLRASREARRRGLQRLRARWRLSRPRAREEGSARGGTASKKRNKSWTRLGSARHLQRLPLAVRVRERLQQLRLHLRKPLRLLAARRHLLWGKGTRRVQLVRRDGRDVSTLYGKEGGGGGLRGQLRR